MGHFLLYSTLILAYTRILVSAGTATVTSYVTITPTITNTNTRHKCFETQLPYCHHVEFLLGDKLFGNAFVFDSMSELAMSTATGIVTTEETELKTKGSSEVSTTERTVHIATRRMSTAPITMTRVAGSITLKFDSSGDRISGSTGRTSDEK
ncbi:hypothetical protein TWF506_004418 [Arthrobotrys conoides]|uniref:Uncharacterized protein n=1 Tax=Arthrobotrys conoides TaxID=74498 RepID=A0AAN8NK07_9PEZI